MNSKSKGEVIKKCDVKHEWRCNYCSFTHIDPQKVFNHILMNHPRENLNTQQEIKE